MKSLLAKRQESIFSNLQQAKQRVKEIEKVYLDTQIMYHKVLTEVLELRLQTEDLIKERKQQYQIKKMKNLQKIQENQKTTIFYQQKKIQKQTSQKIIDFTLQKVDKKFQQGLNQRIQKSMQILSIKALKALAILKR